MYNNITYGCQENKYVYCDQDIFNRSKNKINIKTMWQRKLGSIRSHLNKLENRMRTYGRHENK